MAENVEITPRIFTSLGFAPEAGGYSLAKFSRSAQPYEKWIADLTQTGAEKFYETFYFAYGHASIADLTHVNLIAENIPIVWAIEVFDEALVDGQEASTRYQDFTKRKYYTPSEFNDGTRSSFIAVGDRLFQAYHDLKEPVSRYLLDKHGSERPKGIDDEAAKRTADARTFDRTRYLLPAATFTGLGIILSTRTAEKMITRLLSHPTESIQDFGRQIRTAIKDKPAANPLIDKLTEKLNKLPEFDGRAEFVSEVLDIALKDIRSAPTLVKYTEPSEYQQWTYGEGLKEAARQYLGNIEPQNGRGVKLHRVDDPEIEIAATALYRGSNHSFEQTLDVAYGLSSKEIKDLVDLLYQKRGGHDEPVRETMAERRLIFDIEIDNGAFRDLNRHRNCVKVIQEMGTIHGYDMPPDIDEAGVGDRYREVMEMAGLLSDAIDKTKGYEGLGQYILPLAYRRKFLMKMDSQELQYIVENRTPSDRHFSYREAAYQMYEQTASIMPNVARHIRVVHPSVENFWQR